MELIVGSYEEILHGYRLVKIGEDYQFEHSFTDHTHTSCIKAVAVSKKGILASGGTDEIIQLFNLKKRTQLGSLDQHSGSITWIDFYKNSHMFSCSEDGSLCIWKSFTWECLKTLRGHRGAVNCVSIHPSGRLGLTVGHDKTLRTWNLVTGKSAYITNIKKVAELVFWSPTGEYYVVVSSNLIDVYKLETATVQSSWKTDKRINSIVFVNDTVIAYGGEEGQIFFHDIETNKVIGSLNTDTNRIRGLEICHRLTEDEKGEDNSYLATASSDGFIKVFQVFIDTEKGSVSTKLLASHNTEFRLTCLTVMSPKNVTQDVGDSVKIKETVDTDLVVEEVKSQKSKKAKVQESDDMDKPVQKQKLKQQSEDISDKNIKKVKQKLKRKELKRLNGKKKIDMSEKATNTAAVSSSEKKTKRKLKTKKQKT